MGKRREFNTEACKVILKSRTHVTQHADANLIPSATKSAPP